jgi:aspartyl-tRNA(Asn)/glutamyl-tRNA(Gln) amidotransferase subunit B
MPGVLPVLNREMAKLALRLAFALGCQIRRMSQFARKNYFYPDLPKGYQISQFDQPLAEKGALEFDFDGNLRRIGIRRIHLEEDAGKSFHLDSGTTLVDLNRCGVPLIEIVSEPEIESPQEARVYLTELKRILVHLGICSGDMEKGALRCDANISLKDPTTGRFGIPTEVKNLNSFRAAQRALEFEVSRQSQVLQTGGQVVRETLLWDDAEDVARPMRRKELMHDYRYFPEPDLVRLEIPQSLMDEIQSDLPELPLHHVLRLVKQYGIHREQSEILCDSPALADYFEQTVAAGGQPTLAAGFILVDVLRRINQTGTSIRDFSIKPRNLAALLKLMEGGDLSAPLAREVFQEMIATGEEAQTIVERRGLHVVSDEASILPLIRRVLVEHPAEVQRYQAGETKLSRFFMGQLMQVTRGQGDPHKLSALLERELQSQKN